MESNRAVIEFMGFVGGFIGSIGFSEFVGFLEFIGLVEFVGLRGGR